MSNGWPPQSSASEHELECTRDLRKPWENRQRFDARVLGSIALAFLRGYQSGYEDARAGRRAKHHVNPPERRKGKGPGMPRPGVI